MNKATILLTIPAILCLFCACAEERKETEFYLVRHAEKEVWTNPDTTVTYNPGLSEEGIARADKFKELMADKEVEVIYSTEYDRNMGTVLPLAEYAGIEIKNYHWYEWQDMLDEIEREHLGATIVICGHGDNLLPIVSALGGTPPQDSLGDHEYDKIFHLIKKRDSTYTQTIVF